MILDYANKHSGLTNNTGNIGPLKLSGELSLISESDAIKVLKAYREFQQVQHRLRLTDSTYSKNLEIINS